MAGKKPGEKLTPNQILFCKYYVTEEFFCNGTKAYQMAYDCEYDTAKSEASRLLTNHNILDYINYILEDMALNDVRVDKELAKMLIQDEDKATKMKAIDMYYKISSRVEKGLQKAIDDGEVKVESAILSKLSKILG